MNFKVDWWAKLYVYLSGGFLAFSFLKNCSYFVFKHFYMINLLYWSGFDLSHLLAKKYIVYNIMYVFSSKSVKQITGSNFSPVDLA